MEKKIHYGNLIVEKGGLKNYKDITEVSGSISVREGATLDAPNLTKSGYIYVYEGATLDAPNLKEVSGYIDVREGATLDAPNLKEVSGSIYVHEGATLDAPNLTKSKSIYVCKGATLDAPNLKEVSGYIDVREGATLDAPNLKEVSGYIYVYEGATLDAPNLKELSGYIYVYKGATLDAPNLKELSGYIYVREGATLKINVLKSLKWKSVDGYLFVIESEKTSRGIKIFSGYNVTRITDGELAKTPCYVAEKDGFTAHGDTVKKAIQDLEFKIVSEKLKKEPINADTMIDINHYRILTGACEFGVKSWIEEHGMTEESYRADEILPILEKTNAYGLESFKELINF